jgi:hypothetical protein
MTSPARSRHPELFSCLQQLSLHFHSHSTQFPGPTPPQLHSNATRHQGASTQLNAPASAPPTQLNTSATSTPTQLQTSASRPYTSSAQLNSKSAPDQHSTSNSRRGRGQGGAKTKTKNTGLDLEQIWSWRRCAGVRWAPDGVLSWAAEVCTRKHRIHTNPSLV